MLLSRHEMSASNIGWEEMRDESWRGEHSNDMAGLNEDSVVVVTGAASGVGQAVARRLANRHGAKVVLADVRNPGDEATNLEPGGSDVISVEVDVADHENVAALFVRVNDEFGRLDCLVNCAAVDRVNNVVDATVDEWDWIIGVNLKGVFLCCRAAIPLMRKSNGGAIVNIGSTQGYHGGPRAALYCASKGGVHQLTRCMAIDHASDGIRINCVAPGAIDTPMLEREISQHADPELARKAMADVPMRRIASPDEIAAVACFLLSEDASYMTGAIVTVDGGGSA